MCNKWPAANMRGGLGEFTCLCKLINKVYWYILSDSPNLSLVSSIQLYVKQIGNFIQGVNFLFFFYFIESFLFSSIFLKTPIFFYFFGSWVQRMKIFIAVSKKVKG